MGFLITLYHWDFGDGYSSVEEIPDHSYARAGTYTVTLTAWTDVGPLMVSHDVIVLVPSTKNVEVFTIRKAIETAQGVGWSEVSGDSWVDPKDYYGALQIMDDNDTPRMLLEDKGDDWTWEDATFDRVENLAPAWTDKYYEEDLRNSDWRWVASGFGTNEYYLDKPDGGNPYIERPKKVLIDEAEATEGNVITLGAGEWGWGNSDLLGYSTIYVRLADGTDPDTKAADYVHGIFYTEIACEAWEREIVADQNKQEDKCEFSESHYFTRPENPENKGNVDYNSGGYRNAQSFSLDFYLDGDLTRAFANVQEIPENGDIVFSGKKIEGRRGQFVFKCDTSEIQIAGLNHYGIRKPKQGSREERRTRDYTVETALAIPALWISRNAVNGLIERITGGTLAGDVTQVAGPDGFASSAIQVNANLSLLNSAIVGAYTVFFWRLATDPMNIPGIPAATQYGTDFNGYEFMYVQNANMAENQIITPGTMYDLRIYAGDMTDYLLDLYDDIRYTQEPKQLMPGY